jgi:hypothetical protein
MQTDIEFIDAETQESIGSYTITGESGGLGTSGGTGDAIKQTADAIVEIIKNNYRSWR